MDAEDRVRGISMVERDARIGNKHPTRDAKFLVRNKVDIGILSYHVYLFFDEEKTRP